MADGRPYKPRPPLGQVPVVQATGINRASRAWQTNTLSACSVRWSSALLLGVRIAGPALAGDRELLTALEAGSGRPRRRRGPQREARPVWCSATMTVPVSCRSGSGGGAILVVVPCPRGLGGSLCRCGGRSRRGLRSTGSGPGAQAPRRGGGRRARSARCPRDGPAGRGERVPAHGPPVLARTPPVGGDVRRDRRARSGGRRHGDAVRQRRRGRAGVDRRWSRPGDGWAAAGPLRHGGHGSRGRALRSGVARSRGVWLLARHRRRRRVRAADEDAVWQAQRARSDLAVRGDLGRMDPRPRERACRELERRCAVPGGVDRQVGGAGRGGAAHGPAARGVGHVPRRAGHRRLELEPGGQPAARDAWAARPGYSVRCGAWARRRARTPGPTSSRPSVLRSTRPNPPPRVSRPRDDGVRISARSCRLLHDAARRRAACARRTGMTRTQARLALGLLLSSEAAGDNVGLVPRVARRRRPGRAEARVDLVGAALGGGRLHGPRTGGRWWR